MQSTAYNLIPAERKRSISEVIGNYGIELRPAGKEQVGLCPFHADKNPSMSVNEDKGLFHCFGCGASGDSIRFVELIEQVDFKTACRKLQLETFTPKPRPYRSEAEKIVKWAQATSRKICAALRDIGEQIYICCVARKQPGADRVLIRAVEVELIRRWAILEHFDDDLNNPKLVLELWANREDVERLVEMA